MTEGQMDYEHPSVYLPHPLDGIQGLKPILDTYPFHAVLREVGTKKPDYNLPTSPSNFYPVVLIESVGVNSVTQSASCVLCMRSVAAATS